MRPADAWGRGEVRRLAARSLAQYRFWESACRSGKRFFYLIGGEAGFEGTLAILDFDHCAAVLIAGLHDALAVLEVASHDTHVVARPQAADETGHG